MNLSVIEYSILLECSEFIDETNFIPLFKHLPSSTKNQDKIKIRQKSFNEKYYDHLDKSINFKNFKNRSLTTFTKKTDLKNMDLYFVFIPDGYKYLYIKDNFKMEYNDIFLKLSNSMENGPQTFEEILKYTHKTSNLTDALSGNDEIIFYNIPYYYCIKASKPYDEIIEFYDNIQN